MSKESLVI